MWGEELNTEGNWEKKEKNLYLNKYINIYLNRSKIQKVKVLFIS